MILSTFDIPYKNFFKYFDVDNPFVRYVGSSVRWGETLAMLLLTKDNEVLYLPAIG